MDGQNQSSEEDSKDDQKGARSETNSNKPEFSEDEEMLIARMFRLVGRRWSLIAGRIPGRTEEEIEKYCTSKYGLPGSE
uniref:Small R3-type MYB transcription factor n=1 Tax=Diospyros kaki TaxID=35925 RepID=D0VYK0_DIOKA|nr:small R3-type MYB transcription factor [Diospyros kaki]